ncbi:T7SS effector LXG polymorphic toxin [Enterococcus faecalis]
MSLDFYVGEVQAQTSAATKLAEEYRQFSGQLKDSVNAFFTAPLTGKAYDSAKLYFSTVYPPLANAFILTCEAFIEAHKKLPDEFKAQVASIDVIEDQLKAQISTGQELVQRIADLMEQQKTENLGLEKRYLNACDTVQRLQEKLANLYAFNAYSAGIFSEYEANLALLTAGLAEVEKNTAWNSNSGAFELSKINLNWIQPINTAWEKRQKKIDEKVAKNKLENQEVTFKFDAFGNVIGVYIDGEFDSKATLAVTEAIATNNWEIIKQLGVGIADSIYQNFGLEAIMGERTLDLEAVGTVPYNVGNLAGNLASLVGAGAEFIGGGMWALGSGFASAITAPISGGASLALEPAAVAVTAGIWTHAGSVVVNAFTNRPSRKPFNEQEAREAGKKYKMSDEYFEKHIVKNHGSSATEKYKSKFNNDADIRSLIDETLKDKSSSVKPNTGGRNGYIFEKEYGYPIGKDQFGNPVSKVKVVISPDGLVITAYPY